MAISFNNALGIHEQALLVRTQRAEVLANNLANVDTPNFKARDIDFQTVLRNQASPQAGQGLSMASTDNQHQPGFATGVSVAQAGLMYRTPTQPAIDGNTVDANVEQAEFMKNALDYQASFRFLNGKFKSLISAIKGE